MLYKDGKLSRCYFRLSFNIDIFLVFLSLFSLKNRTFAA